MSVPTKTTLGGLVIPADVDLPPEQEEATQRGAVAYWKARCEAVEARIADPAIVLNAANLVRQAAEIAYAADQSFRQVFEACLKAALAQRASRNTATRPAARKRRK